LSLIGGPGSGKGTQCDRIKSELGFTHLSTGDLFRNEIKQQTPRAKQVQEFISQGKLIPVETTLDILADAVETIVSSGDPVKLLLDGFPRELSQVDAFKQKVLGSCANFLSAQCSVFLML
jgi:adenylate kinase family enzyme